MANETQNNQDEAQTPVKQNPGGYVGSDPPEVVTQFTDEGIVVVNKKPAPADPSPARTDDETPDKANVSQG